MSITGTGNYNSPLSSVLGSTYQLLYGDLIARTPSMYGTSDVYDLGGIGNVIVLPIINGVIVNEIFCIGNFITKHASINSNGSVTITGNGEINSKCIKVHGDYASIGKVLVSLPTVTSYALNTIFGYGDINIKPADIVTYGQVLTIGRVNITNRLPSLNMSGSVISLYAADIQQALCSLSSYGYVKVKGVGNFEVKIPKIFCSSAPSDGYTIIRHTREC